jgi:hypothetical protein
LLPLPDPSSATHVALPPVGGQSSSMIVSLQAASATIKNDKERCVILIN